MSLSKSPPAIFLPSPALRIVRRLLGGRRGLIAIAVIMLLLDIALGWSWLVAVGVAPLLLGLMPCAAMCALGLCMNRMPHDPGRGQKTMAASSDPAAAPANASPGCLANDRAGSRADA
jgi:hypothetical protein